MLCTAYLFHCYTTPQAVEVIRGTSAADEQLRHELWETWRLPTVVRPHAAVTDRPKVAHQS